MMPRSTDRPSGQAGAGSLPVRIGRSRWSRALARLGAVAVLGFALIRGLYVSGELDYDGSPFQKWPGQIASLVGFAADDIKLTGLTHHDAESVLDALNIRPGGSLIGFDAAAARDKLANLDWVSSIKLQRLFPNQLEIEIVEKVPFAVWQRDGNYFVIDQTGAVMQSLAPGALPALPLVTGSGADKAAAELINQVEASPGLSSKLYAAARIGQRRWNLYMTNGLIALLPERDVPQALARLQEFGDKHKLFERPVKTVDLRFGDKVIIALAEDAAEPGAVTGSLPEDKRLH